MTNESFENVVTKKESTQEDRIRVLRTFLQLIGRDEELQSFLDRGQMGKPQRGDSQDSFYMMSGIKGGARIIGLGKLEGRFIAYLSEGTHEEMRPLEIEDQAGAAQLIADINKFL